MPKESTQKFLDNLSKETKLSPFQIAKIYRLLVAVFKSLLLRHKVLHLKGIGTFRVVNIKAREGISPVTQERIIIPSHHRVNFQNSDSLKKLVNKK